MKVQSLKVVHFVVMVSLMLVAVFAFSATTPSIPAATAANPQDLNPPTNLACLPFPQGAITGYNGNAITGPVILDATQTTITWRDESDSEESYRIHRRVPDGEWVEIATLPADSMIYTDTGLPNVGGNYIYRVGAQEGNTTSWRESCRKPMFLDSSEGNFRIFYRPYADNALAECPDVEDDEGNVLTMCASEAIAEQMADTLEASYAWIMTEWIPGTTFPDPLRFGPKAVDLTLCDGSGCVRSDDYEDGNNFIALRPSSMAIPFNPIDPGPDEGEVAVRVPRHELFHTAQQGVRYGGDVKWVMEGTARSTDDKFCLDAPTCYLSLDHYPGGRFVADSGSFLADPNRTLFETSYHAALFWTYISEQYGTITDEPQRGIDFFVQFWASGNANAHSHGREVIDFTLADMGYSETFEDVFKDFVVANYAKDIPNAPDKYKYIDEGQSTGSYGQVFLTDDQTLSPGEQYIVDENVASVEAWGARYFRFNFFSGIPTVDVKAATKTGDIVYYTLLGIKNGSIVEEINHTGADFNASIPNDELDEMVFIIAGLDETVNFNLSVNATQPELRIQDPLATRPIQAGDPTAPEKIFVKVEVLSPDGGVPIAGIEFDSFTIAIGGSVVPQSQVINSAYIQGEYWFLVRAPLQAGPGSYDLLVTNDSVAADLTLTDTEADAVIYGNSIESDNLIVGDRSGSMDDFPGKLEAAKDAGRLYVDAWESGDQFGVVSYNENAVVNPGLEPWSSGQRTDAFTVINNWTASGGTGIGNALIEAMDELVAQGDEDHPWHIFLISDGMETEDDPNIEDFVTAYNARLNNGDQVPTVHAVALGPDADQAVMQTLANDTGGTYEFAGEDGGRQGGTDLLSLELAEIYRVVAETISNQQQILSERGSHPYGPGQVDYYLHVEGIDGEATSQELIITVKWDLLSFPATVQVRRPDGVQIPFTRNDTRHLQYRVQNPMAGDWHVAIFYTPPGEPDGRFGAPDSGLQFDYIVEAAVKSDLTMDLFLGLPMEERQIGNPMPILISLSDLNPLPGATVNGVVTTPSGTDYPMTFFDDGAHGDAAPGDGFYGNTFYFTSQPGSYQVRAKGVGESTLHGEYIRRARASFYMDRGVDSDQDGLPDHWEDDHGLDPETPNPTNSDPDGDTLFTFLEFQIGTHPLDSDTDNGGESDGSEYERGAIPQDFPRDDAVRPVDATGWAGSDQVWLTFTTLPPGGHVKVFRGTDVGGPFAQVGQASGVNALFLDGSVRNGTTYCYRTVTVNADQRESGGSEVTCLTPKADPIAPEGHFVINQDMSTTSDDDVILSLSFTDVPSDHHIESDQIPPVEEGTVVSGVSHVMVSNFPDFTGGVWVAVHGNVEFEWKIEEGEDRRAHSNGRSLATVYVKFRDAAGNESELTQDSIWFEPSGEANTRLYLPLIQYQASSAPVEVGALSNPALARGQVASQSLGNGLVNGNFEEGPAIGWEESSAGGNPLVIQGGAYAGNYAAALCGYPSCQDSISQEVTIPTVGATLSYHYRITGGGVCGTTFAVVQINDTVVSRHDLCHDTGGSYKTESINLSAFAGQTVRIRFEAADASSASMGPIRVDNVTLKRGIIG